MQKLNGIILFQAVCQGAQRVIDVKSTLNKINVFPVVDSDTGNNLASLMRALQRSRIEQDASVPAVLNEIASQSLLGAKGNSGMIFASYLVGVRDNYQTSEDSIFELVSAFSHSVQNAVSAISNPEEGTILTVMRAWASTLKEAITNHDFQESLMSAKKSLHTALEETRNHRLMRQYGVVDAGALGFVEFINGLTDYFLGNKSISIKENHVIEFAETEHVPVNEFPDKRYCIEMVVSGPIMEAQKAQLNSLGNSLVVIGSEVKSRIHVHSDDPIEVARVFNNSTIEYTKVDDMVFQYNAATSDHPKIALVTDSIADIDPMVLEKGNMHVLSLPILVQESEYLDKLTIDNKWIFDLMSENRSVSSSMVSAAEVQRLFEMLKGHYEAVLIVTVAQKLSGTYSLIEKLAREYSGSLSIHVLDSYQNSIAQGALVEKASEMIREGLPIDILINRLDDLKKKIKIYVSVSDLKPMIKSGRIPVLVGRLLQRLGLKAVISLDDEGEGTLARIVFTQNQVARYIRKQIEKHHVNMDELYYGYTSEPNGELRQALKKMKLEPKAVIQTSAIIALSAGNGAEAIAFIHEGNEN